jgi:hypothetical protein
MSELVVCIEPDKPIAAMKNVMRIVHSVQGTIFVCTFIVFIFGSLKGLSSIMICGAEVIIIVDRVAVRNTAVVVITVDRIAVRSIRVFGMELMVRMM